MKPSKISILLVNGSGGFRNHVKSMLQGSEFTIWEAHDSPTARNFLASPKIAIDILLCDIFERSSAGWDLAIEAAFLRPGIKILLMSSRYLDAVQGHDHYIHQGLCLRGTEFILKPFTQENLLNRLQTLWEIGPTVRLDPVSGYGIPGPSGRRVGGPSNPR